ncbi:MAG: hypothetical protein CL912_20175 [Deltaproteobacteria bacterium]|nr:hypothetical protein [Deltaproteobacteria bacterium]
MLSLTWSSEVAIGFCTISDKSLLEFPGWPKMGAAASKSWAYHGDDGRFYCYLGHNSVHVGEPYGPGDVIGCGVDFGTGKIWYTRNGTLLGLCSRSCWNQSILTWMV